MIIALPWYALYPLAPPRFMQPYGWPFVDTLAVYGPNYFSESGLVTANRFAAMPSMHGGWTLVMRIMLSAALPWRWTGRVMSLLLVGLIAFTVIVTANHYWIDIIGGWVVVGLALFINWPCSSIGGSPTHCGCHGISQRPPLQVRIAARDG